jgi:Dyp-type peroxidase family
MSSLQVDDIQGLVLRSYGRLKGARYLGLQITESAAARDWLRTLDVRNARAKPRDTDTCLNVAVTPAGLEKLGLGAELLELFAPEFREGMTATAHRRRLLGDVDDSAPSKWKWGSPDNEPIHVMLMVFARDEMAVRALVDQHRAALSRAAVTIVVELDSNWLPDFKEHFGFRDGISQPHVEGFDPDGPEHNRIAAGEFVLGYENGYGQSVERPLVSPERDPLGLLPQAPDQTAKRDLGMNGSYMVFRQLSQDVAGFWQFVTEKSERPEAAAQVRLAAKMVGRWPDGTPLVKAPDAPLPVPNRDNDFLYYQGGDAHGLKCPLGAHVRRTNPRDSLDPEPGSARSIEVGKRHRILRRGRTYGPPVADTMTIPDIVAAKPDSTPRGLHFICFNTHIGRQFEFIQHTWVNSPKFDGLYAEDDPLVGPRAVSQGAPGGTFTMQAEPIRKRVTGMPRFVQTLGGAYFFMPGIRALRFLAALG